MNKFQDSLQKVIEPIAAKLQSIVYLRAIRDGISSSIPMVIIGSFALLPLVLKLLSNQITGDDANTFGLLMGQILPYSSVINKFTTGIISVYVAFFIGRELGKHYQLDSTRVGIFSILIQLILVGVVDSVEVGENSSLEFIQFTNLGATGLFVSIISASLTAEVFKLCKRFNLEIKLPEGVPEAVSRSFSSLIPLVIVVLIAILIDAGCLIFLGSKLPDVVMGLLTPIISQFDNFWVLMLIVFIAQLLWFFGLHGPSLTESVWGPIAITFATQNVELFEAISAGQSVSGEYHFLTMGTWNNILCVTGSGITFGLIILMMMSKNKGLKEVGRFSLIPSIFGINEPVIFGTPIILNPYLFIPFVFGPVLITGLTGIVYNLGLIGNPVVIPPGFMPAPLGAFFTTLDWRTVVWVIFIIALMTLIYLPFFKMFEKSLEQKQGA